MWDDDAESGADKWVTESEASADIIDRYRRVCDHADATITTLGIDAPGHVSWWPQPDVILFNVLLHVLTETTRHAGHADILREHLDGATGIDVDRTPPPHADAAFWENRCARIEQAAQAYARPPLGRA